MRTTLDLPDDLYQLAAAESAREGLPVPAFLTRVLRAHLPARPAAAPAWTQFYGCMTDLPADELASLTQRIQEEAQRPDPLPTTSPLPLAP